MAPVARPHETAPLARFTDAEKSGALLRAFFRLAEYWQLSQAEQSALLGGVSRATLARWREAVAHGGEMVLSRDRIDRLSYLMGIHKALHLIYPYKELAYGWPRRPNEDFGGRTPLDVMTGGGRMRDLDLVRVYLDDVRGGAG